MSCSVQEGVVIVNRGESHGIMLCSWGMGGGVRDSGQGRITRYYVVFVGWGWGWGWGWG